MRNARAIGDLRLLLKRDEAAASAPVVIGSGDRKYEMLRVISQGGMGTVSLGRMQGPLGFSKRVAIKSLRPDHATNPAVREMFINEARLTARLNHANIASTVDVLIEANAVYIVMEYIDGRSVADLCKQARTVRRRIPVDVACAIAHDALLGLDHAHDACDDQLGALGIVHCDVSPQNVRVGIDGLSRILDFGIARAAEGFHTTSSKVTKLHGKIPYMAPEQLQGATVDRRADVYATGVLLWEMLAGRRLFAGETPAGVIAQVLRGTIERPSTLVHGIPPELDNIVMKALNRDPEGRFPSAGAMAAALSTYVASRRTVADVLHELSPTEYTPVSGVRQMVRPLPVGPVGAVRARTTTRRPSSDALPPPLLSPRTRALCAGLAIVSLGLLGLAIGASRHASVATAAARPAATVAVVAPARPVLPPAPTVAPDPPPPAPPAPPAPRALLAKEASQAPAKSTRRGPSRR